MLTMLLGGLWHGANWTFVLWGFLHGLALLVHRQWVRWVRPARTKWLSRAGGILAWFATLSWVIGCFTIFRCPDIATAAAFFSGLTESSAQSRVSPNWVWLLAVLALVHWVIRKQGVRLRTAARALPTPLFYGAMGATCAVVMQFISLRSSPFIYFQF
jgi:D-alanyl-lipoteichoic acid acyltransferase DltB (MBOAT superfamily)